MPYKKYAADIKLVVVRWAMRGIPTHQICERLGFPVYTRSITRWLAMYRKTRAVVKDPALYEQQGAPGLLTSEEIGFLEEILTDDPTLYVDEAQELLYTRSGKWLSNATVLRILHEQLRLTLKTGRTVHPQQSDESRGRYLVAIAEIPPDCLVFVDESGVSLDEVRRTQAWAPVGRRTARLIRRTRGTRYNLVHAIGLSGGVGTLVKEGNVKRKHFVWYLKHRLLPFMNRYPGPNSVLVADNARIHKGEEIEELCNERGVRLIFLPAYSPDFNPIEKGFSAFKAHLRRHRNLDCDDKINAIYAVADDFFGPTLCTNLFRGSAYI